jgi:predicted RNA-binding protein
MDMFPAWLGFCFENESNLEVKKVQDIEAVVKTEEVVVAKSVFDEDKTIVAKKVQDIEAVVKTEEVVVAKSVFDEDKTIVAKIDCEN